MSAKDQFLPVLKSVNVSISKMKTSVFFVIGIAVGMLIIALTTYSGVLRTSPKISVYSSEPSITQGRAAQNQPTISSAQSAVQNNGTSYPSQAPPDVPEQPESSEALAYQSELLKNLDYPDWWKESWPRSAVHELETKFAGDKPLFRSCGAKSDHNSKLYNFIEPKPYIPNSKNPCYYELPKSMKGLKCLPYVYLAGVAKCGTTDLAKRLRAHPDVFEGTSKEYHWWERQRFGDSDKAVHASQSFKEYLQQITGPGLKQIDAEIRDTGSSVRIFGDFSPSYLWDPRHWQELEGNEGCKEPRYIHTQHIRHLYTEARIILTFRHPTPRLYSRFLSRIPRTPELQSATSADFHTYVVDGVKKYKKCFKRWSVRHCAYNDTLYRDVTVRLVEGMYPVFMADWLRVWPRHQMFIMRYEDYGGHEQERLAELLQFLRLAPLNSTLMNELMGGDHIFNSGSEEYKKYGSMLPETHQVLDEFYQPFINQFATMLQDTRFLWLDVKH